jgi:hypothetical protein
MTESSWARRDLWQSPKSSPQILTFLSAEPEMSMVESEEMSRDITGSLCPYRDRKNLSVSAKKTFTVLSSSATARNLPSWTDM